MHPDMQNQNSLQTYKHVLEGADVGVVILRGGGTGEPGENNQAWTGDHYPATFGKSCSLGD